MTNEKQKTRVADLAGWLQRKAGGLSIRVQKILFALVICFVAGYCIVLVTGGGNGSISVDRIRTVKAAATPEMAGIGFRLKKLESFLDSLSTTADGRRKLDSILSANPGIRDSIQVWKNRLEID